MEAPSAATTAAETMAELRFRGHRLVVITRVDVHHHKTGPQPITSAEKLWVSTPPPLTDDLRASIRAHRDELLAVACVINPPVPWMRVLVERYRNGRTVPLAMVAANVAAFIGLDPATAGPRLVPIIREALE
jgi:hypothetical protein